MHIKDKRSNLKNFISSFTNARVEELLSIDWNDREIGRWYDLGGNNKLIFLDRGTSEADIKEYHKVYTDIHIVLEGKDFIQIGSSIENYIEEYNATDDYALVKSHTTDEVVLEENEMLLLEPYQLHSNFLSKDSRKVVLKIENL
ncbi:YhcH/YjgK/YiaL family protein [Ekhidna sp.]|uniref:YhcH/YjgK/YiaL family protein n=1 Tax=Ekhidna sp. TaxID=2608089 RepID=UPI00329734A3